MMPHAASNASCFEAQSRPRLIGAYSPVPSRSASAPNNFAGSNGSGKKMSAPACSTSCSSPCRQPPLSTTIGAFVCARISATSQRDLSSDTTRSPADSPLVQHAVQDDHQQIEMLPNGLGPHCVRIAFHDQLNGSPGTHDLPDQLANYLTELRRHITHQHLERCP